jgi:23S rRNA pseudouridine955/2504/2580 synthase
LRRYTLQSGERRVRIDLHGDKARTDFEIQQRGARVTRLWVYPHTGRTHQIRVHAAAEGHAVVGDNKYQLNGPDVPRMMLHSRSLKLPDGRRFDADPDETFVETWSHLMGEPD